MKIFSVRNIFLGLLGLLVGLVVLVVLVVQLVGGSLIRGAIVKHVPPITGTSVEVARLGFSPFFGSVEINELTIGNPEGYHSESAMQFSRLHVKVDTGSLLSDKIIVEEIVIEDLAVTYETGIRDNNLKRIKENIDAAIKRDVPSTPAEQPEPGKPAKKVVVRSFRLQGGKVNLASRHLGGAKVTLRLGDIEIRNIGEEKGGVSTEELVKIIFDTLLLNITRAVSDPSAIKEAASGIIDQAVDGGIEEAAEKAKGLLKNLGDLF